MFTPLPAPDLTEEILQELAQVRASGAVNMIDLKGVRFIADRMGLDTLVGYCDEVRKDRVEWARNWMATCRRLGEWVREPREEVAPGSTS